MTTQKKSQRGAFSLADLFLTVVVVGVLYWGYNFVPHYYVKYKFDKIVVAALNEWKDTDSERKAEALLHEKHEAGRFPAYLPAERCKFRTQGLFRHIECEWHHIVKDPIFKTETLLKFKSHKYLDANGFLEDEE